MTLFFVEPVRAQNAITQRTERINGKLYVVEHESKYEVLTDIVTVKLKERATVEGIEANKRGYAKISVPKGVDIEVFAKQLDEKGCFESIIYNTKMELYMSFNDNTTSTLWHLNKIKAPEAWDITTGNPSIKMAIIDTGIDADHPDLGVTSSYNYSVVSKLLGWDYYTHMSYSLPYSDNHGTAVAGVAGAKTNNGMGTAGICGGNGSQGLTIIPYRLGLYTTDMADAIDRAVSAGANVINISMGTSYNQEIEDAIEDAYLNNVCIVCATGKNGNAWTPFPASSNYTIGVGSCSASNLRSSFSDYGLGIDLVAPGESIYTTDLNNTWGYFSGTSFAAPQVAATIALMLSVNPNMTSYEIRNILRSTAVKISPSVYSYNSTTGWNQEVGCGMLNTFQALLSAVAPMLEINGSSELCGSEIYSVSNLPNGATVQWSFLNSSSSANSLLQSNYPVQNQCIINIENNENLNETLVAEVYYGGYLINTLTKAVSTDWNLSGTYSVISNSLLYNDVINEPFSNNTTLRVWPGSSVSISSSQFANVSLSHTYSPKITWSYDGNQIIQLSVSPLADDGHTMTITGTANSDCDNFKIGVRVWRRIIEPLLNLSPDNILLAALKEDDADYFMSSRLTWDMEIINTNTGEIVYKGKTVDTTVRIDASEWSPGLYAVKHEIDEQIIIQKINIKILKR